MTWISDIGMDLRYALRTLRKHPGFTAVVVATIAFGIGANTAIFTLFDALLLRSLPVREPTRLVLFSDSTSEGTRTGTMPPGRWDLFSTELYAFFHEQPLPFESIGAVRSGDSVVSVRLEGDGGSVERAQTQLVSGNYFGVMGVDAARGRVLADSDDLPDASPVAVVSDGFWRQRLHADTRAIGRIAMLNGTAVTIVGVAPREFFGERVRRPPDFWVPLAFQPQIELRPSYLTRPDAYWLKLIGRLRPDAQRASAQTAVTDALRRFLAAKDGTSITDERRREIQANRVQLADGAGGVSVLRQLYAEPLRILLAVVALVLLMACINVGNLLIARATAREGEVSLRAALGASRARLVRQMLTESLLLAIVGAACGVILGRWVTSALLALVVSTTSPVKAALSTPVLLFTVGITLLAGTLFGLAPALYAARTDLLPSLKTGGRRTGSFRGRIGLVEPLVVAQIALSVVLLVGANLFARSLLNLQNHPLGFDRDHVLIVRMNPRLAGYKPADVAALYRKVYERVSPLPGVQSATLARYSPLGGSNSVNAGSVDGYVAQPGERVSFETLFVGPSYPATMGIALLRGRAIGIGDAAGTPKVAMVNDAFARHFFGTADPIGHRFGIGQPGEYEIVGVLQDVQFQDVRERVRPGVFLAMMQDASQFALDAELDVRSAGDPAALASAVRAAITEIDRMLPINDARTLREQVASAFNSQRLAARLVSLFGGLALLLATVGLYGVISQGVARRTTEIGVRMALGAERRAVVWMILRGTLILFVVGLAIGIPAAFGAARVVASQLFGLTAGDPLSFALAVVVLAVAAVVAGLVPARRASRVDPLIALRSE